MGATGDTEGGRRGREKREGEDREGEEREGSLARKRM